MRFEKKLKLLWYFMEFKTFGRRNPFWIDLKVTSRCNTICKYCDIASRKEEQELSREDIFRLTDETERYGSFISLGGGEPLLRKDIGEIIEYIQEKDGIFLCIWSNGLLVDKHKEALKKVDLFGLSLDGPRGANDLSRGKGTYDKTIEAIEWAKHNRLNVVVHTTLTKDSVEHLAYLLNLSREYDYYCSFHPIIAYPLAPKNVKDLALNKEELRKTINYLIEKKKEFRIINSEKCLLSYISNKPKKCFAGKLFLHIDSNGDVYPCGLKVKRYNSRINCRDGIKKNMNSIKCFNACKNCYATTLIEANIALTEGFPFFSPRLKELKGR